MLIDILCAATKDFFLCIAARALCSFKLETVEANAQTRPNEHSEWRPFCKAFIRSFVCAFSFEYSCLRVRVRSRHTSR